MKLLCISHPINFFARGICAGKSASREMIEGSPESLSLLHILTNQQETAYRLLLMRMCVTKISNFPYTFISMHA